MRADNARVWHWSWSHFSAWWFPPMIRKGGRHIPAWPRVWDARHIPAWPRVWDATAARVSLGAARPIPIMTSRERHITRLTSLSNITTVAYTASRVRWERFRVYFCRAYKLFVETFCFVANDNIITTVAYTASRVHWERFCVSFKTKSERTTCLLYNVLFYITFCYITFCSGWTLIFVVIWCYLTFWARVQKTHQYTPYKPLKWGAHY